MARSEKESPVMETSTPGLMRRGLETGPWGPYPGTKLETAETAKFRPRLQRIVRE